MSFRGVTKVFPRGIRALADFCLDIADGEFLVIVGPSGCGKSTTLRILAGIEEPTSGRVFIGDADVTGLDPGDRDVAMVFQNYALYPHMTVFDNMAFALRMRGESRAEIDRRVSEAAGILGMEGLLGRRPRDLSGGERQRVAVGRAIVRKPAAFLFDEPLSNLDAKLRLQMRSELARLHARLGATMIYVTHDQAEAMTLGDRIVVLRDGVVQQVAEPLALYERPVNAFVAGFIGTPAMNMFRVRCRSGAIEPLEAAADLGRADLPDGEYIMGVRPEDVSVGGAGIPASVELVETLGNEKIIYLATPGGLQFVARCSPSFGARQGDAVTVGLPAGKAHFFDQSGERIARDA